MRKLLAVLAVFVFSFGAVALANTGPGPVGNELCPDHDNDGICNGQDPDYVPGSECPNPDCPNPDCPNHESLSVGDLPDAVKSMIKAFLQLGVLAS